MRGQKALAKRFEFYFADLDNSVLVECAENGGGTIRAMRDNVSDDRKAFFIRELATEGFIPDTYQWFQGPITEACGIQWITDTHWNHIPTVRTRRVSRVVLWLIICCATIWFLFMSAMILPHFLLRSELNSKSAEPHTTLDQSVRDQR